MKDRILEILACPTCLTFPFAMKAARQSGSEIEEGILACPSCAQEYPIIEGIPRLLTAPELLPKEHIEVRDANIKYHDVAAETYETDIEESIHQSPFNQKRINDIIEDLARKTTNDYFLDVGCGTGNLLKLGRKYFDSAVGTDVSVNMLKIAKSRGCEVLQADASCLPFKFETFNVVSIFSVLHHLFDYGRFIGEAARILKPSGFLYTDWDPQKQVKINRSCWSWRIYELLRILIAPMRRLKTRFSGPKSFNLREIRPELKHLYEKAEYRNLALNGEERGIDYNCLQQSLLHSGFTNIQPTYHWAGKGVRDLPVNLRIKLFFLRLQGYTAEQTMENLMIVAQKDDNISSHRRIEESSGSRAPAKWAVQVTPEKA